MQNLAGKVNADKPIRRELEQAGISVEQVERTDSEVPYSLIGKLGKFKFFRAWYYWVVEGPVPIEVADELIANPVGKTHIRVAGHIGRPSPQEWAVWLTDDGKRVYLAQEEESYRSMMEKHSIPDEDQPLFSDNPESLGAKQYITTYHIDDEDGLRLFADTLRAHGLVQELTPA